MITEDNKCWAEELLRQKNNELNRLPCKDDFDEPTRSRIKAFLGPWPRALEAAGLKDVRPQQKKSKKRKKTVRGRTPKTEPKESVYAEEK